MSRFRTGVALGLSLLSAGPVLADDLTVAAVAAANAPFEPQPPALGVDALRLFKGADWTKGRPCAERVNLEIRLGGRSLRLPSDKLASLQISRDEVGTSCAGDPVQARYVGVQFNKAALPLILAPYAARSNLVGLIAAARTRSTCTPGPKSDLETCVVNRDSDPAIVVLDRAGPVDEFDNPPALVCLPKSQPACFQPVVHATGLIAVVPTISMGSLSAVQLRQQHEQISDALATYVEEPTAAANFDPGRFAPTNAPLGAQMLAIPVDNKNAARGDLLAYRACGAKGSARLHIGGVEIAAPLAQVRQVRFGPTTRTSPEQRKMLDMTASCGDTALYLRSAYLADETTGLVINGRGRSLRKDSLARIDDLRKADCTPASETVVSCQSSSGDRKTVLHSAGASQMRLSALCTVGSDGLQTCQIGGESDLGFSYSVPVGPEPMRAAEVQAKVAAAYQMLRTLNPRSTQAASQSQ